jgi:hypothetical protein
METTDARLGRRIRAGAYPLLFLLVLLLLSVLLEGCADNCVTKEQYTYFEPVYTPLATVRGSVAIQEPADILNPGRLYYKDGYLFINEVNEGVHIIDDRDPANPEKIAFLKIPGNTELAMRDQYLYANSYMDLVVIDLSDPARPEEAGRAENLFYSYSWMGFAVDPVRGVVTDWVEKDQVSVYESDCEMQFLPWGGVFYESGLAVADAQAFRNAVSPAGMSKGAGTGGSLARFTVKGDYLYALDGGDLQVVDLDIPTEPAQASRRYIGWDIETIFPAGNLLYLGSRSGMHIVDITYEEAPNPIGLFQHVRSCDPVVVEDTVAYVTLRSGTECEGFTNQLELINVSDPTEPSLMKVFPMFNPGGLGIDEDLLFICDGTQGLKIFDASDYKKIGERMLARYADVQALDVIPLGDLLIVLTTSGFKQFDYRDPKHIRELSEIIVTRL